jgi:L-seryl-tRNA(Ser) seleniumtransferase
MSLRNLPSVEKLLQTRLAAELIASYGRPLTLKAIRDVLEDIRLLSVDVTEPTIPGRENLLERARQLLRTWTTPSLHPVINATGVILHTNLGRAPLSASAIQFMDAVARGYTNLEFDLETGKRGSRLVHVEVLLKRLTGVEAAMVVNNNAAAVLLILSALASRRQVIVSRSQLVEIGGGFRVPDVMTQSRAKLVEVGTTNRVRVSDYEEALSDSSALVVHTHRSNFKIIGFTEEPTLEEIVATAHAHGIPCVDDLGSGALLPTERYGLAHEPTVQESLKAGVDLVCFSGDKLLGGPQAGIIIGRSDLIARLKKHPLARAMRADKTCLAALTATLLHYLRDEVENEIPIWRMIAAPPEQIKARAERWADELKFGIVMQSESTVGGGSLPGENLPTWVLGLRVKSPEKFLEKLRHLAPAVIARVENDLVLLDPRTVLPEQDGALLVNLMNVLEKRGKPLHTSGVNA